MDFYWLRNIARVRSFPSWSNMEVLLSPLIVTTLYFPFFRKGISQIYNCMCCSGPEGRNSGFKICRFYYLYNFKCSNHLRPSYLSDLFSEYQPSWTLGCSSSLLLVIPNVRTKPHSEASFSLLLPAACQRASGLRLFLLLKADTDSPF